MLLQDPSQVDGAHKKVLLQRNALTRPEPGRQSTREYYYKEMLLQDPSQVDGAHQSTITKKCSYKTRARSTEHTRVLLQRNALTRPEPGRQSTQTSIYHY